MQEQLVATRSQLKELQQQYTNLHKHVHQLEKKIKEESNIIQNLTPQEQQNLGLFIKFNMLDKGETSIRAETKIWEPSEFVKSFKNTGLEDILDDASEMFPGQIQPVLLEIKCFIAKVRRLLFEKLNNEIRQNFKKNYNDILHKLLENIFNESSGLGVDIESREYSSSFPILFQLKQSLHPFVRQLPKILGWMMFHNNTYFYVLNWNIIGHPVKDTNGEDLFVVWPALYIIGENEISVPKKTDIF